jgi:DNA-directed RNA polymerase sigma subunit (sigma70/sigma32)
MPESVSEMRKQLRELRKANQKPVSKMSKMDCAMELERLKHHSATTPAVAQHSPSEKRPEKSNAPTLKKLQEHPQLTPAQERMAAVRASKGKKADAPVAEKKTTKKDMMAKMAKMMEAMSDSE